MEAIKSAIERANKKAVNNAHRYTKSTMYTGILSQQWHRGILSQQCTQVY